MREGVLGHGESSPEGGDELVGSAMREGEGKKVKWWNKFARRIRMGKAQ